MVEKPTRDQIVELVATQDAAAAQDAREVLALE